MKGLDLISAERHEQIDVHGYDNENDDLYRDGELGECAVFAIIGAPEYYPSDWNERTKKKIFEKDRIGQLAVAGALIAAEIDRLLRKGDNK